MKKFNSDMIDLMEKLNEIEGNIERVVVNQQSLVITLDILLGVLESKKVITKKEMQKKFKELRDSANVTKNDNIKESPDQQYFDWLIEECKTHGNA